MFYEVIEAITKLDRDLIAIVCGNASVTYGALLDGIRDVILDTPESEKQTVDIISGATPVAFIQRVVADLAVGRPVLPILPSTHPSVYSWVFSNLSRAKLEPSILHFTSGSYGVQKIVVRPTGNLLDEAHGVATHLGLRPGSRVMITTPLEHSFGCGLWRAAIYAGATIHVSPLRNLNDRIVQLKSMMMPWRIDFMFGVPYLFRALLRAGGVPTSPQTKCFAGGEVLSEALADQWYSETGIRLQQEYGLGEGGITTLANPETTSMSIGVPIPGVTLKIDNPDAAGVGELVVYRKCPPTRYLFGEAAETFQPDGGIRTGDLGYVRGGEFYLSGRIKSIIIVAGMKLVPREVEDVLCSCPDVDEAVVIGVKDGLTGERPMAFVTKKSNFLDVARVWSTLRSALNPYKVPKRIQILDELPRTASGKVDRNELQSYL